MISEAVVGRTSIKKLDGIELGVERRSVRAVWLKAISGATNHLTHHA